MARRSAPFRLLGFLATCWVLAAVVNGDAAGDGTPDPLPTDSVIVTTGQQFLEAVRSADIPPTVVIVNDHLDFPDGVLPFTFLFHVAGNCSSDPPYPLPTPRTSKRQCVIKAAQNALVETVQFLQLIDLYILVSYPVSDLPLISDEAAGDDPAVISFAFAHLDLVNVHFQGNNPLSDGPESVGRALYLNTGSFWCYGCSFDGFVARDSSAVAMHYVLGSFVNATFSNNRARATGPGGRAVGPAIGLRSNVHRRRVGSAWFHSCTFTNNTSPSGVPIAIDSSNTRVFSNKAVGVYDSFSGNVLEPSLLVEQPENCEACEEAELFRPEIFLQHILQGYPLVAFQGTRMFPGFVKGAAGTKIAWAVKPPYEDSPRARVVSTPERFLMALRDMVEHVVVAHHLDFRPAAVQQKQVWALTNTRSVRGNCSTAELPALMPPRVGGHQCFLTVASTIFNIVGFTTRPLLLVDLYIRVVLAPTRNPQFQVGPPPKGASALEDFSTIVPAPAPGPEEDPYDDGYDDGGFMEDALYGDAVDLDEVEYNVTSGLHAMAIDVMFGDLWMIRCVVDGSHQLGATGLWGLGSSVYIRDSVLQNLVDNSDGFQDWAATLHASKTNFVLVNVTMRNNAVLRVEAADPPSSTVLSLEPGEDLSPSRAYLEDCKMPNNTIVMPEDSEDAADAVERRLLGSDDVELRVGVWPKWSARQAVMGGQHWAAEEGKKPLVWPAWLWHARAQPQSQNQEAVGARLVRHDGGSRMLREIVESDGVVQGTEVLVADGSQQLFSNQPLNAYAVLDGVEHPAQAPTAQVQRSWWMMHEGLKRFEVMVQDQAQATGLPVVQPRLLTPAPEEVDESSAPAAGPDSERSSLRSVLIGTVAVAGVLLALIAVVGITRWTRHRRKPNCNSDTSIGSPAMTKGAYAPLDPLQSSPMGKRIGTSAKRPTSSNNSVYGAYGVPPVSSSDGNDLDSMFVRTVVDSSTATTTYGPDDPGHSSAAKQLRSDPIGALEDTLDNMFSQEELFIGEFQLHSSAHRRRGGQGVVQFAQNAADGLEYVIKFFFEQWAFQRELELYQNEKLRSMMPAVVRIEQNVDVGLCSSNGLVYPPFIIVERGESLNEWAHRIAPDGITSMFVLCHVAKRLKMLHAAGLSHRDLKPANILWRPRANAWTLIDFGCAAVNGEDADLVFSLLYAAPELIDAVEREHRQIKATPAVDIWALGLIAYELLSSSRTFPSGFTKVDVCDCIMGRRGRCMPWEDPANAERLKMLGLLRRTVLSCLERDPEKRPSAIDILNAWNGLLESTTGATTGIS